MQESVKPFMTFSQEPDGVDYVTVRIDIGPEVIIRYIRKNHWEYVSQLIASVTTREPYIQDLQLPKSYR